MALISVAGASSRAGKTSLCVTLLRSAPVRAAAVKFTSTEDVFERCPRGSPCVVCDIDRPFRLVTDERTLREPGTDTDRLAATGAAPVVWAIARAGSLRPAWQAVGVRVAGAALVVMEGSTVVELAAPDLLLYVVHPWLAPERWKTGSDALVARADVVLVNRPAAHERPPSPAVLARLRAARGREDWRVADATRPLGEWAPDALERVRDLAARAAERGARAARA